MRGIFGRMIQCTKGCLQKTCGNATVNYQELLIILKEIENMLNNCQLFTMTKYYNH